MSINLLTDFLLRENTSCAMESPHIHKSQAWISLRNTPLSPLLFSVHSFPIVKNLLHSFMLLNVRVENLIHHGNRGERGTIYFTWVDRWKNWKTKISWDELNLENISLSIFLITIIVDQCMMELGEKNVFSILFLRQLGLIGLASPKPWMQSQDGHRFCGASEQLEIISSISFYFLQYLHLMNQY